MTTAAMAFLITADGPRSTCLGCSQRLLELGMVRLVMVRPFSAQQPEFSVLFYALADDYTIRDCREAISDRHVGAPWGA